MLVRVVHEAAREAEVDRLYDTAVARVIFDRRCIGVLVMHLPAFNIAEANWIDRHRDQEPLACSSC